MTRRSGRTRRGGRAPIGRRGSGGSPRFTAVRIALVMVLVVAAGKLVWIQGFASEQLASYAEQQRSKVIPVNAPRGTIYARDGQKLAVSTEKRALMVSLQAMRRAITEETSKHPDTAEDFDSRVNEIAGYIAKLLPEKTSKAELLRKFHKDVPFTYLVEGVNPSVADRITAKYPSIGAERRAKRMYPAGELAACVLGYANWRMNDPDVSDHGIHGLLGLESSYDDVLSGNPGKRLVSTAQGSEVVIPGTEKELEPADPGTDLRLTIDPEVQYEVQRMLSDYVSATDAEGGSAAVMDVQTGELYALANDSTFNPNDPETISSENSNNTAVTTPFEPGSVAKIITAAGVINYGLTKPQSVYQVPDHVEIADRVIRDAWNHMELPFTTAGIFGKSSNVGTLKLAEKLGPDRWMTMAKKFGLGQRTGIALPGESAGYLPPQDTWSGSTFGNLPIGQGMSMTLLQMTGMFQTIANDGVRVEPRIIKSKIKPDGSTVSGPSPDRTRVVDEQTADTVLGMLRGTVQEDDGRNQGTAPSAALAGYQISGKTGTAEQVNEKTGAYGDEYNITFAGTLSADNPRFVIGIRLDAPDTTLPKGSNAGPLFHDIAAYLAQHYQVPVSDEPAPYIPMVKK